MKLKKLILVLFVLSFTFCSKDNNSITPENQETKKHITIFHINDPHGSIENFSKIKYLIDKEKKLTNVLFVVAGDIFSGNPIVDNHEEKGFPIIDLMNKTGIDIAVLGNHEFDYGETILNNRINQSEFDWICANIDTKNSTIPQPKAYKTLTVDDIKVTFLGLVETNGSDNEVIPSTHPWRVQNFTFTNYSEIIRDYSNLKSTENSNVYIGLTHLGLNTDISIANEHPFLDIIIGGHSHSIANQKENDTYIYQAGSYLRNLGKISVTINEDKSISANYELINLSTVYEFDQTVQNTIGNYNENSDLDEVIGFSGAYHNKPQVGNFYTYSLLNEMNVDLTFQNTGGIRNTLDEGDITKREIYAIDPFNNGSVTYNMKIGDIKYFLEESREGLYYAGLTIEQSGDDIIIKNDAGEILNDNTEITLGINDYIPAVHSNYFTSTPTFKEFTTAETIINYLNNNSATVNHTQYSNYFKYQ